MKADLDRYNDTGSFASHSFLASWGDNTRLRVFVFAVRTEMPDTMTIERCRKPGEAFLFKMLQ